MTRREFDALTQENHGGLPGWDSDQHLAYRHRRGHRWRLDVLEQRRVARRMRPDVPTFAAGGWPRLDAMRAIRRGLPILTWPQSGRGPLPLPEPKPRDGEGRAAA